MDGEDLWEAPSNVSPGPAKQSALVDALDLRGPAATRCGVLGDAQHATDRKQGRQGGPVEPPIDLDTTKEEPAGSGLWPLPSAGEKEEAEAAAAANGGEAVAPRDGLELRTPFLVPGPVLPTLTDVLGPAPSPTLTGDNLLDLLQASWDQDVPTRQDMAQGPGGEGNPAQGPSWGDDLLDLLQASWDQDVPARQERARQEAELKTLLQNLRTEAASNHPPGAPRTPTPPDDSEEATTEEEEQEAAAPPPSASGGVPAISGIDNASPECNPNAFNARAAEMLRRSLTDAYACDGAFLRTGGMAVMRDAWDGVLLSANRVISRVRQDYECFKIGVCINPVQRWGQGYQELGYDVMELVLASNSFACVALEKALTDQHGKGRTHGCQNQNGGGGGMAAIRDRACFCYVVACKIYMFDVIGSTRSPRPARKRPRISRRS